MKKETNIYLAEICRRNVRGQGIRLAKCPRNELKTEWYSRNYKKEHYQSTRPPLTGNMKEPKFRNKQNTRLKERVKRKKGHRTETKSIYLKM